MKSFVIFCTKWGILYLVLQIYRVLQYIDYFELGKIKDINDDGCVKISSIGATEDQTKFNEHSVLLSEWRVVDYTPGEYRPGSIYVASGFQTKDFDIENDLKIERLPIIGYPEKDVDFHPHGMYVRKEDRTLYVINHGYDKGGERIDVFDIVTSSNKDDDDMDIPVRLVYKYGITSEWMKKELNGALNSIVVVSKNKFYVTQYEEGEPLRVKSHQSLQSKTRIKLLKYFLFGSLSTHVWYCEYTETTKDLDCRIVADQFLGANGITHNEDYSKIFVADWKSITIFDRDTQTKNLSGRKIVKLPNFVDNIKFDDVSGNVYGGTINNLFAVMKHPYPRESNEITGGVVELQKRRNYNVDDDDSSGLWEVRQVVTTAKLNCISNGIRIHDSYYLLGAGGIGYKGLLVCPISKDNINSSDRITSHNTEL